MVMFLANVCTIKIKCDAIRTAIYSDNKLFDAQEHDSGDQKPLTFTQVLYSKVLVRRWRQAYIPLLFLQDFFRTEFHLQRCAYACLVANLDRSLSLYYTSASGDPCVQRVTQKAIRVPQISARSRTNGRPEAADCLADYRGSGLKSRSRNGVTN
ncbi:hypothetical protein SFRURICE_017626 [Spodoptera frugiperda]|nr:hypothetical protein SFRURICE_017626 [Spodoptera frugiperda]